MKQTRRAVMAGGALWLLNRGTSFGASESILRVGLITDLHHADKPTRGSRHYRESIRKLDEAGKLFSKFKPDFVVELGDIIDAADSVETELRYLKTINEKFKTLPGEKHYVLGNHCVDTLTKEEFLGAVGQEKSYYSFDKSGVHFVVLDACFKKDGTPYQRKNFQWNDANIPEAELKWLKEDLASTKADQVIVFAHQRLDLKDSEAHTVKNASVVRSILEKSGKVRAVFQGHSHKNDHREIDGTHYVTMVAMVEGTGAENNGYSTLEVFEDGSIRIEGYRNQNDYEWANKVSR